MIIGAKKGNYRKVLEAFENENSRKSILELTNCGFSINDATEIYSIYKEEIVMARNNN